jgi:hypothetical protein
MFSEQWRNKFTEVYNEMMDAYSTNVQAKVEEHERTMLTLMLGEQGAVRALLTTRGVPEKDVDAAVKELSENASRIHSLKIFHERGIHLDPSFYMRGWVLSQADLYLFERNRRDITLRHLANNGCRNPNDDTLKFLKWAWEQLQQKDATNLFCIIENFYCNQPWKLIALSEQEYWVLFFYAFAHVVYAEP